MKFIYIDQAGNQVGPVDEAQIERLIREGALLPTTAIRNAMLREFRTVAEFDCFSQVLASIKPPEEAKVESGAFGALRKAGSRTSTSTSFSASYTPQDAGVARRLMSAFTDFMILGIVAIVIFFFAIRSAYSHGETVKTESAAKTGEVAAAPGTATAPNAGPASAAPATEKPKAAYGSKDNPAGKLARMIAPKLERLENANAARNEEIEAAAGVVRTPAEAPKAEPAATGEKSENAVAAITEKAAELIPAAELESSKVVDGKMVLQISPEEKMEVDEATYRHATERAAVLVMLAVILYYSLSLAIFAQTAGMWYWGVMLTKSSIAEVYFLRAFVYALLLPILGVLMVPAVLASQRSVADWLCGVRQIRVCSAPR